MAENAMEIRPALDALVAASRAVGIAIGAGVHTDEDERREAAARSAVESFHRSALAKARGATPEER